MAGPPAYRCLQPACHRQRHATVQQRHDLQLSPFLREERPACRRRPGAPQPPQCCGQCRPHCRYSDRRGLLHVHPARLPHADRSVRCRALRQRLWRRERFLHARPPSGLAPPAGAGHLRPAHRRCELWREQDAARAGRLPNPAATAPRIRRAGAGAPQSQPRPGCAQCHRQGPPAPAPATPHSDGAAQRRRRHLAPCARTGAQPARAGRLAGLDAARRQLHPPAVAGCRRGL
ncbi:hypothetical protein D3C72_1109950 [compost metagenome]